jgi:hypothetical protein
MTPSAAADPLSLVTVTKLPRSEAPGTRRCAWCGRPFTVVPGPGRPRRYCRRSCRQRDYEARRQAAEVGLGEAQLVIARAELDGLHDRLYELEAAIEDVDRDMAAAGPAPSVRELQEALDWLLTVARPLAALRLGGGGPIPPVRSQ